ncbi:MAG: hypothetical protein KDD02_11655 [Phaeodactylibacter sp.]|nr:hypothetical protein [Phaeodactylibacter sp.]MCB9299629.1 hypothetical protein [Lewinellaceae bacterium]
MNLKQANILLEKINALHKSMSMDEASIASIEKDLMLSYIKQLYELFLQIEPNSIPKEENIMTSTQAKRAYKPPRIIEIPDSVKSINQQQPPSPGPEPVPRPGPQPNPEPAPGPQPNPEPPSRPAPQPPQPPQPEEPSFPEAKPYPYKIDGYTPVRKEVAGLFEFRAATELSEKLSERPVNDLTKALAINDRLLYMNELFGKDLNTLNDTLSLLNKYDNMDQAKGLLANLAEQYNWIDEERQVVAKDFIKLVRRRYV